MKLLAILLSSLLLVACGGGNEPITSPPTPSIQASVASPVKKATTVTGGNAVVIHMYQALYGMAPSNALLVDYAFQANNDASTFAKNLTDRFATTSHADLAKLVLDNLGVTPTSVPAMNAKSESEYSLLLDAVKQLFGAYPTMRGQIILNMTNLLTGLESDTTYGKSALVYNNQTSGNFDYASKATSVTPRLATRKVGLFFNYALVGYWNDQQASSLDVNYVHQVLDRFKQDGYTGVEYEITVGVTSEGKLMPNITFDQLMPIVDYGHSIGLGAAILVNWTLDGGNASYLGNALAIGQADPPNFNMVNFFQSVNEYFAKYAPKFEAHHVDLLYVTNQSYDYFAAQYYENWKSIISSIRQNYSGSLTYNVQSVNMYRKNSVIESIAIWNLLDAIAIEAKPYISKTPVVDINEVISGYYYSKLNYSSLMSEVIAAAQKYQLPIMLQTTANSTDDALTGGWDPTTQQALQVPLPTNSSMQAMVLKAFFHVVQNNLYPFVTGTLTGNYNIFNQTFSNQPPVGIDLGQWALWKNWPYFDMELFPTEAENVIKQYFASPTSFRQTNVTQGGPENDTIYTKNGNNRIYLSGGYDEVHAGDGDDQIVISPLIVGTRLSLGLSAWYSSANSGGESVAVFVDGNKSGTINFSPDIAQSIANPGGYWTAEQEISFQISDNKPLPQVSITCTCTNVFVQITKLGYGKILDPNLATHTVTTPWSRPNWVVSGDVMTYNLNRMAEPNSLGAFTYIDGGAGSDTIEFTPPQSSIYFQIKRVNDLTIVTDPLGVYPEVRVKNVEWIKFSDLTISIP